MIWIQRNDIWSLLAEMPILMSSNSPALNKKIIWSHSDSKQQACYQTIEEGWTCWDNQCSFKGQRWFLYSSSVFYFYTSTRLFHWCFDQLIPSEWDRFVPLKVTSSQTAKQEKFIFLCACIKFDYVPMFPVYAGNQIKSKIQNCCFILSLHKIWLVSVYKDCMD